MWTVGIGRVGGGRVGGGGGGLSLCIGRHENSPRFCGFQLNNSI